METLTYHEVSSEKYSSMERSKLELLIYEEKQAKNNSLLWYCGSETSIYRNNLTEIEYLSCKYWQKTTIDHKICRYEVSKWRVFLCQKEKMRPLRVSGSEYYAIFVFICKKTDK